MLLLGTARGVGPASRCAASIVRGSEAQGIGVTVTPQTEVSSAVTVPAYSDICYDCGLVSLFVRVGEFKQETG